MLELLIVLALACYRVTRFVIRDTLLDGGRDRVHHWLLTRRWKGVNVKLYELITCPFCLSIWVAAGMVAATDAVADVTTPIWMWLAAAAGSLVAWEVVEHD